MSSDQLVIKRVFNCSKRALFDAWSQGSLMSRWFFAASEKVKDSKVDCQFNVGGQWSVTMYFEDGSDATLNGVYKTINRYSEIAFSWNSSIAMDALVQLSFKELSANRTELKLVHSQLPSEESLRMHNQGWDACLANLEAFVKQNLSPADESAL